ncbi:NAD(P)H-dependent oxidoreductase [Streptomyces cavernicola]|uniref:NAD(P)H-dependent oxidoreductase n=1 Tax=Streptomyces cavernicola TaxID=3043613 RepID=A0ABT6SCA4_9ACTN|nr:NAD(P)H-dependent oxidoreductase [Streptomyces sp. B-S-A6]MDI3405830.1 NAD(P)H-dependent oxidoreductase [Streptomyces sp. B-S-A6]
MASGTQIGIYLAHPRPGSFNHALAEAAATELRAHGCLVRVYDLYAEGFDPLLPADATGTVEPAEDEQDPLVRRHRREVTRHDALVFVHPNWWGMPPAVLTGWVQRVLAPGVAYKLGSADAEPAGLLRARRALVLNTSDTPAVREEQEFGDPLQRIWAACVLPYVGVAEVRREVFRTVTGSAAGQRATWLRQARQAAAELATA